MCGGDGKEGRMISAETTKNGNTTKVTFDGDTPTLALELSYIVTKGVTIMSGKFDANNVEATLYALMMTVIEDLNEDGYKVDHKQIGLAMMMAPKRATVDK